MEFGSEPHNINFDKIVNKCCGAVGAEIIFLKNIYNSQFGGCQNEEKPPLRHISYGTAGAEIMDKGGAEAENKSFWLRNTDLLVEKPLF